MCSNVKKYPQFIKQTENPWEKIAVNTITLLDINHCMNSVSSKPEHGLLTATHGATLIHEVFFILVMQYLYQYKKKIKLPLEQQSKLSGSWHNFNDPKTYGQGHGWTKLNVIYRLPQEAVPCLINVVCPIVTSLTKGHISEVATLIRAKITLCHCASSDGFHFGINHIYIPPEPCAVSSYIFFMWLLLNKASHYLEIAEIL